MLFPIFMYSKKHYKNTAEIIAKVQLSEGVDDMTIELFKQQFINEFSQRNEFDSDKFINYINDITNEIKQ